MGGNVSILAVLDCWVWMRKIAATGLATSALLACEGSRGAATASAVRGVLEGLPDTSDLFESVVLVARPGGGFSCSGTLITPTSVLTAAHCVCRPPPGAVGQQTCEATATVRFSVYGGSGSPSIQDIVGVVHGYHSPVFEPPSVCNPGVPRFGNWGDLAVINLGTAPQGIRHMPLDSGMTSLGDGDRAIVVGYGITAPAQCPQGCSGGQMSARHMGAVKVSREGYGVVSTRTAQQVAFGDTVWTTGSIAFGDSGGALVVSRSGEHRLAGVNWSGRCDSDPGRWLAYHGSM
jgi:hypothetical protein